MTEHAASTLPDLESQFELADAGGELERSIDDLWSFGDDRVFGGYVAGLAVVAASSRTPYSVVMASHSLFAAPTRPGPVVLRPELVRAGRSTALVRVVIEQHEAVVLTSDVWFASAVSSAKGELDTSMDPDPGTCPPIAWLSGPWPFMRYLDDRAIDYPLSLEEFANGPARVRLWSRPSQAVDGLFGRVYDVMLLDAHLLDAAIRPDGILVTEAFSLDLTINWCDVDGEVGWTCFASHAHRTEGFATCSATLSEAAGTVRAVGLQQGRLLPVDR